MIFKWWISYICRKLEEQGRRVKGDDERGVMIDDIVIDTEIDIEGFVYQILDFLSWLYFFSLDASTFIQFLWPDIFGKNGIY